MTSEIKVAVITSVATMLVTGAVGWLIATSSAGQDAAEEARFDAYLEEKMKTDGGSTLHQEVHKLNNTMIRVETSMGHLADAIDNLAESQE